MRTAQRALPFFLGCVFFLGYLPGAGAAPASQDPLSDPGFVHFYNNEYDEAIAVFQKAVEARPNDPDPLNHLAQGILYREMFRNGALESQLVTGNNPFIRRPKMGITPEDKQRFTAASTARCN